MMILGRLAWGFMRHCPWRIEIGGVAREYWYLYQLGPFYALWYRRSSEEPR